MKIRKFKNKKNNTYFTRIRLQTINELAFQKVACSHTQENYQY